MNKYDDAIKALSLLAYGTPRGNILLGKPKDYLKNIYLTAIEALKEKQAREENKPLTLEELKQMDGEPVWVKCLEHKAYCETPIEGFGLLRKSLVRLWHKSDLLCGYGFDDYGKTWLAYRYKPNNEKNESEVK